jgi:DNA-binding winged helix-turn-helix (wHTH) protein
VSEKQVYFGEFLLDFGRYQLMRGEHQIKLEFQPLQLLMFLVENRGQLVTREQIADALWGKDVFVDVEQGINTAIRKVRQVLEDDPGQPQYLQTVVGRGYRFVAPAEVREQDVPMMVTAEELGRAIMSAAGLDPNDLDDASKWRRQS